MSTEQPKASPHGARPRHRARLRALREQHGHAAFASLGRLARGKAASLMSVGVVAIALALPLGLAVLVHNATQLSGASRGSTDISVFLAQGLDKAAIAQARESAAALPNVAKVRVISPDEALASFKKRPAFSQAL